MALRRTATSDTGEVLDRIPVGSFINYDTFQIELQKYKYIEDAIISNIETSVAYNVTVEQFTELLGNFAGKDKSIRRCIDLLNNKMEQITPGNNEPKSYQTELNKLEMRKLETFKWILNQELSREKLNKREALKKFMSHCVNNDLTPDNPR